MIDLQEAVRLEFLEAQGTTLAGISHSQYIVALYRWRARQFEREEIRFRKPRRLCLECREPFIQLKPARWAKVYCSKRCYRRMVVRRETTARRAEARERPFIPCLECEELFQMKPRKHFCGRRCRRRFHDRRRRQRERALRPPNPRPPRQPAPRRPRVRPPPETTRREPAREALRAILRGHRP